MSALPAAESEYFRLSFFARRRVGVAFVPGFHIRKMSKTNKQLKWHVAIDNAITNIFYIYTWDLLRSQKVISMWQIPLNKNQTGQIL
jgi:hypothetical protein